MGIKIDCPACSGTGTFKALETKCTYCKGHKKIHLARHLRFLGKGKEQALANVEDFNMRTKAAHAKHSS